MANAFQDILNRLFSNKVVIKKMPSGRIKTVDFNRLQSSGNYESGKFRGLRMNSTGQVLNSAGYSSNAQIEQLDMLRNTLYIDYELMDNDPILAGALDIYADEVTVNNAHGDVLTINCSNSEIKQILHNLHYDVLNIEFNLWSWVRTLCKFGDLYLYTPTHPTIGIIDAIPIHPSLMNRRDNMGVAKDETRFIFDPAYASQNSYSMTKSEFTIQEISHMRLLTNTNFLPYGKSMLEGARKVFKQLSLMEDAMLIHRIMRAPERRIFKIDVGNIAPEEIDGYMENITNSMKKVPFMDQDGEYNLRYNMMNMLEDYYLPVRGGDTGTDISSLAGLGNDGQIDDIEYLRNKMMAFLKIPKSYMGYDDVGGKTTLPSEDIRFARTIERIQKMVTTELYKISVVHLMTQGFKPEQFADFTLNLAPPSMIYERQRVDLLNEKVNLIANIKEQKLLSNKYIYENILSLSPEEWKAEEDLIITDLKLQFRQQQIIDEGNDPSVTGKSFGTAHDIAQMHVASKLTGEGSEDLKQLGAIDDRHENGGRPLKHGSFERAKDGDLGYDPFGRKQMNRNEHKKFIASTQKFLNMKAKPLTESVDSDDDIEMLSGKLLFE